MKINAYAKINLFLDIVGRREDGYHDICGVMQRIDLYDEIEITRNSCGETRLFCNNADIPLDGSNLALKAANVFFEHSGEPFSVDISITKNIPLAAGLAGGSADAAGVLLGLNELDGNRFGIDELLNIGASLGADVPFCVLGGAAITEGIGEKLTPIKPLSGGYIVVAKGGEGVSTPLAYRALDERHHVYNPEYKRFELLKSSLESEDLDGVCKSMYNIFEDVVLPTHSMASAIKKKLLEGGAKGAMMSGSGPSVFGIFNGRTDAERALGSLLELKVEAFMCKL